jgi:hypothetical protein
MTEKTCGFLVDTTPPPLRPPRQRWHQGSVASSGSSCIGGKGISGKQWNGISGKEWQQWLQWQWRQRLSWQTSTSKQPRF